MAIIAQKLLSILAPILTYTVDEVLEYAPKVIKGDNGDVFDLVYESIGDIDVDFDASYMGEAREKFFEIVDNLKKDKKIKSTLEIVIQTTSKNIAKLQRVDQEDWFTVSKVISHDDEEELATFEVADDKFKVLLASKAKCPRCWKQRSKDEESLCERCSGVVSV